MKSIFVGAILAIASLATGQSNPPSFKLAWSEYPSWSAIDVASTIGAIDGRKGKLGSIEQKYNVDIELKLLDYDSCITSYGTNDSDAVCITNIDILSPSFGRRSVAIMPTSTSFGGDALLVPNNVSSLADLQGQRIYGLGKSVSEFCTVGILEAFNIPQNSVTFVSMDPAQVANALQGKDDKITSGMLWEPFTRNVLKTRKDMKVLADSRSIPFQIIDMVVVGSDSLKRPGGEAFARAVCEAYYTVNQKLNGQDQSARDSTLIAIGEKFTNLGLADMRSVVQKVRFFGTPEQGVALFNNQDLRVSGDTLHVGNSSNVAEGPATNLQTVMKTVVDRCKRIEIITKDVTIAYGDHNSAGNSGANLCFDPQYMTATVASEKKIPNSPLNSPPLRK